MNELSHWLTKHQLGYDGAITGSRFLLTQAYLWLLFKSVWRLRPIIILSLSRLETTLGIVPFQTAIRWGGLNAMWITIAPQTIIQWMSVQWTAAQCCRGSWRPTHFSRARLWHLPWRIRKNCRSVRVRVPDFALKIPMLWKCLMGTRIQVFLNKHCCMCLPVWKAWRNGVGLGGSQTGKWFSKF